MTTYIFILLAFIVGAALAWWVAQMRPDPRLLKESQASSQQLEIYKSKTEDLGERNADLNRELKSLQNDRLNDRGTMASLKADLENGQQKLDLQKEEIGKLHQQFSEQFKNLAQEILEEKTAKFTEQNKENLQSILMPLQVRIKEFQSKVEDSNTADERRNATLIEQLRGLKELNQSLGNEARSLTRALKGESKTQGNWGEYQLEKILNAAGLEKNIHYRKEENFKNEEGSNQRPDYFLNLPDGKHLILDAKVSLTAYLRYTQAEEEKDRALAVKEHLLSIHGHIKQLGERNYQKLPNTNQPDYVLLFVANEPALHLAFREDDQLFEKALLQNIVLVSNSTLLATLRTIGYIWRQDAQNKNADEIARQAASLYDKFRGFTDDILKIGKQLDGAQKSYGDALGKLSEGKDNLVRKVERMRKLGSLDVSKSINPLLKDGNDTDLD
jgi:DNA recombination protein RmuC